MPYKNKGPIKEFQRSRVMEIAPDVWEIEGYIGTNFLGNPPSSNIFILRDDESVLLIDTGTYQFYREPMLEVLRKFKEDGATSLILMLTQGHFDHVSNNDVIHEAGYKNVRFLLPEVEYPLCDLVGHWTGEFEEMQEKTHNPFAMMPMKGRSILFRFINAISTRLASKLLKWYLSRMFDGIDTLKDEAEILTPNSRIKKTYGDVEFLGWEVGRFFIIHDGTHSPGHCSFYDPKNKLFLTGDATLEINPAFFNSSMTKCIEMMGRFAQFAEQGYVELATDAHRSSIWSKDLMDHTKREPLSPLQTYDMYKGKEQCAAYYRFFENYYKVITQEVLEALSRLGEGTVKQIVKEFKKTEKEEAKLKIAFTFPEVPSRLDVLVAVVLTENKIPVRREGNKIIFSEKTA